MTRVAAGLILLAAVIHLLPLSGVLSGDRLRALYGVAIEDPNLVLLMRHRAVLFGIVGGLLVAAAFHPPLRRIGIAAGLVSALSFLLLTWVTEAPNAELRRVAVVDVVAVAALVGAAAVERRGGR